MAKSLDIDPLLKRLDRIIELLEERVSEKREPVPVIPQLPDYVPVTERPSCPKCGIALTTVMGYACNVSDCPTGLGPTMC